MTSPERLKMPSPRSLIKKHYHLLLSDYEDSQELRQYLAASSLLYFSRPDGLNRTFRYQGRIRPSQTAIDVISALINFHVAAYEEGYTFGGKLSIKDYYWLPRSKSVKIQERTFRELANRTESGAKKSGAEIDFRSLSQTITRDVFRTKIVPKELKHLLELMMNDPIPRINLIKHNIILLDDEAKVARYIILHQKLVLVKMLDEKIYRKALSYLKCGICKDTHSWQTAVLYHPALLEVFTYKRNEILPADEEGVSVFGRHACHHMMKYAIEAKDNSKQKQNNAICSSINVQKAMKTDKIMKFSLADIFPILDCCIPELFSQLQEAVFEIIELLYPQELEPLRSKKTGGA